MQAWFVADKSDGVGRMDGDTLPANDLPGVGIEPAGHIQRQYRAANEATFINSTGNPGLATAGTGDVLAGICAALLAQGAEQTDAARLAVWLHGLAADTLKKQGIGPTGMTASELMPAIRACLNEFIFDNADKCDEQGIASDKKTLSLSRSNSP